MTDFTKSYGVKIYMYTSIVYDKILMSLSTVFQLE